MKAVVTLLKSTDSKSVADQSPKGLIASVEKTTSTLVESTRAMKAVLCSRRLTENLG